MKIWNGNDFEYLGYFVKNNKKAKYFEVFDKNGNLLSDKLIGVMLV